MLSAIRRSIIKYNKIKGYQDSLISGWRFPSGHPAYCLHCGICLLACPNGILELDEYYYPYRTNMGECENCQLCSEVCPGEEINFPQLFRSVVERDSETVPYDPYLGPVRETYLIHDSQEGAPLKSSSGGAITALMRHALKTGLVDAVCSTAPDPDNPARFRAKLVTDPADLEPGRQAKYQVVPIGPLLRELNGIKKVAFSANGCQVAGLRKLQYHVPEYREKVPLVIGFFCSTGHLDFAATEFMVRKACRFDLKDVTRVEFRHGKYPGYFRAEHRSLPPVEISKNKYKWLYNLYTEHRCLRCIDLTAELADVSFGDPYYACTNPEGQSAGVIRSSRGRDIFDSALKAGEIAVERIHKNRFIEAQRMQFWVSRRLIPDMNRREGRYKFIVYKEAPRERLNVRVRITAYMSFQVFRFRYIFRWFFERLPFRIFAFVSQSTRRR